LKPFDIFIAYISWESGGKSRPVLIFRVIDENASVYQITTQYENKSEAIQANFFRINDWEASGLDKQSYIDTGKRLRIKLSAIDNNMQIGKLTKADTQRFYEFLNS